MLRMHRHRWLALGVAAILVAAAVALFALVAPVPVDAALRSASPAFWLKVDRDTTRLLTSAPARVSSQAKLQPTSTPSSTGAPSPSSDSCIGCHTSENLLKRLAGEPTVAASIELTGTQAAAYTRTMPSWEQVLVDEAFLDDVHAKPGCISCHGGTPDTVDFADAHSRLRSPDRQPDKACGSCHKGLAKQGRTSTHYLQWGIQEALAERGADLTDPVMAKAYTKQCTTCHATCGDCHVNRTQMAGSGLADGHSFSAESFDHQACTSCHSQTVAAESAGIQGAPGDFHEALGMSCTTCHATSVTFHAGSPGVGMYDGRPDPACTDCHQEAAERGGDNLHHTIHSETVQCQVCHASGPYASFDDYASLDKTDAVSDTLAFKIGRNPAPSDQRPWSYVLLREVPFTADTFAEAGENLLPGMDEAPSWMLATPHNMQRRSPQNESCNACHGQEALFLTADDFAAEDVEANQSVIVPRIPARRLEVPQ